MELPPVCVPNQEVHKSAEPALLQDLARTRCSQICIYSTRVFTYSLKQTCLKRDSKQKWKPINRNSSAPSPLWQSSWAKKLCKCLPVDQALNGTGILLGGSGRGRVNWFKSFSISSSEVCPQHHTHLRFLPPVIIDCEPHRFGFRFRCRPQSGFFFVFRNNPKEEKCKWDII